MKKEFNKEEYNKLCAEFCGYIVVPAGDKPIGSIKRPLISEAFIHYDEDWNWIMEIVDTIPQKVQGINVSIHPNSCLITDTGVRGKYSLNASKNIVMITDAQNRKEAVIQAIWEFLNWYNEQKQ